MIGATAKAEQFYERAGSEATKGSRAGANLLGWGIDPALILSEREARESRRESAKSKANAALHALTNARRMMKETFGQKAWFKWRAKEVIASKDLNDAHATLREINAEYRTGRLHTIEAHFVDVCRETMTRAQFQSLLEAARLRALAVERAA